MILLIDGHNLIPHIPGLSLADPDDEYQLILRLEQYHFQSRKAITVIFDPGLFPNTGARPQARGIKVIFAPYGSSADTVIRQRLAQSANPREIMLVTSDLALQQSARAYRAEFKSSAEFARQITISRAPAKSLEEKPSVETDPDYWIEAFKKRNKDPGRKPT